MGNRSFTPREIRVRQSSRAICLSRLNLTTLLIVRLSLGDRLEVHFDDYPRYAKALLRWLRMPEPWILSVYGAVAGDVVRRLPRGDALRDQGSLVLRAMQVADDLCVGLEASIAEDPWNVSCGEFLGAEPAAAFAMKRFSWDWAWPAAKTAVIARSVVPAGRPLMVIWSPSVAESWRRACDASLRREGVESFSWPAIVQSLWCRLMGGVWSARIIASVAAAVARRGIRSASSRPSAVLATELVDPRRMGGGPAEIDHWIDGHRLRRQDVLFFVLGEQRAFLKRKGVDIDGDLSRLAAQDYRIIELHKLPLSLNSIREIARALVRLPVLRGESACMGVVSYEAWRAFLAYLPLFDHYAPRNVAHTLCPNGVTEPRLDSGVVTGLCRRRGSRSVGYQNRLVLDSYEFDFDCYDLFLAWGAGWWDAWRPLLRRAGRVAEVGCSNIEGLDARGSSGQKTVVIFTYELNSNHYSASYNYRLLRACVALARRHPQCRFIVKMKDPQDVDVLLGDFDFRRDCESAPNFTFARLARFECAELLRQADIVVAAAYTTPGGDALLAGKSVIFYSELGGGCQALAGVPGLVAETSTELEACFGRALSSLDRDEPGRQARLRGLDPYRDGAARGRIIDRILEAQFP